MPDSKKAHPSVQAPVDGADLSSLDRARALVASKGSEDPRARERAGRGTQAAELLGRLGMDAETRAAALLLPLLEEGVLDEAAVKKGVGVDVARLTQGARRIASLKDLRMTASEAAQANRLRQMLLTIAEDPRVVLVSLAHQVCVLRRATDGAEPTRRALGEETLDVFAPLANRLGVWQLKQELEDLAFQYLEPETYRRIAGWLDERHTDRERYIARVVERLREEFDRAGVSAEISGRPKHIYGVWSKMRRKGLDVGRIFDVLGFRILVNEVSDCYAALGVVHGLWEPILDEFDDYIAKPKPNGYQSLHSAVIFWKAQPWRCRSALLRWIVTLIWVWQRTGSTRKVCNDASCGHGASWKPRRRRRGAATLSSASNKRHSTIKSICSRRKVTS